MDVKKAKQKTASLFSFEENRFCDATNLFLISSILS